MRINIYYPQPIYSLPRRKLSAYLSHNHNSLPLHVSLMKLVVTEWVQGARATRLCVSLAKFVSIVRGSNTRWYVKRVRNEAVFRLRQGFHCHYLEARYSDLMVKIKIGTSHNWMLKQFSVFCGIKHLSSIEITFSHASLTSCDEI